MQQSLAGMAAAILLAYAAPLTAAGVVQEMELSGMAEVPANASTAVGVASVTHDALAHTLRLEVDFSGMLGATVGAHIHCCADANTNAPTTTPTPAFPLGVTEGSYDITLDLTQSSSFYPSFITGNGGSVAAAEAVNALLAEPFDDDKWIFEPKWDGFRTIIFRDGDELLIQSRDGKPLDRYFPELHEALVDVVRGGARHVDDHDDALLSVRPVVRLFVAVMNEPVESRARSSFCRRSRWAASRVSPLGLTRARTPRNPPAATAARAAMSPPARWSAALSVPVSARSFRASIR